MCVKKCITESDLLYAIKDAYIEGYAQGGKDRVYRDKGLEKYSRRPEPNAAWKYSIAWHHLCSLLDKLTGRTEE